MDSYNAIALVPKATPVVVIARDKSLYFRNHVVRVRDVSLYAGTSTKQQDYLIAFENSRRH